MAAEPQGMLCPICKVALVMTERQNVEIDYCPKCRGVWLDRGELDKIVEKAIVQQHAAPQASAQVPAQAQGYPDDRYREGHHGYRRKSWLSDIFD